MDSILDWFYFFGGGAEARIWQEMPPPCHIPLGGGGLTKERPRLLTNENPANRLTMCSLTRASTTVRSSGIGSFSLVVRRAWASVSQASSSSRRAAFPRMFLRASCRRWFRWRDRFTACTYRNEASGSRVYSISGDVEKKLRLLSGRLYYDMPLVTK